MAKNNFLESANGIQKTTKELLERLTLTQSSVGELLVSVRHSESELLEKEEQKRKAREERERMERLRDLLDSDQDHAAHAGGRDDDELPPQPQQKPEHSKRQETAVEAAAEKPVSEPAAPKKSAEEKHVSEKAAPEKSAVESSAPVKSSAEQSEPEKHTAEKAAVEQPAQPQAAEQAKPVLQEQAPATTAEAPKKNPNSGYEAHTISQDDRRRPQQGNNYPPRQDG